MKFFLCPCLNFTYFFSLTVYSHSGESQLSVSFVNAAFINTKPTHISLNAYRPLCNSALSTLFCRDCKFSYSCVIGITVQSNSHWKEPLLKAEPTLKADPSSGVKLLRDLPKIKFCISKTREFHSFSVISPPSIQCLTNPTEIFCLTELEFSLLQFVSAITCPFTLPPRRALENIKYLTE